MEYKRFKDFLEERQDLEEAQAMRVDPAMRIGSKSAGQAVAKTLQTTPVSLGKANTDPRMQNKILGKAMNLAMQRGAAANTVNVQQIASKVSPRLKV